MPHQKEPVFMRWPTRYTGENPARRRNEPSRSLSASYLIPILWMMMIAYLPVSYASSPLMSQDKCETRLLAAIQNRDFNAAMKIISSGANPDEADCNGTTPLIESLAGRQFDVTQALILAGANPNLKSRAGSPPLGVAAWYCEQNAVVLLLAKGSDVNAVDSDGYSGLMHSAQNCDDAAVPALLLRRFANHWLSRKVRVALSVFFFFTAHEIGVSFVRAARGASCKKRLEGVSQF